MNKCLKRYKKQYSSIIRKYGDLGFSLDLLRASAQMGMWKRLSSRYKAEPDWENGKELSSGLAVRYPIIYVGKQRNKRSGLNRVVYKDIDSMLTESCSDTTQEKVD